MGLAARVAFGPTVPCVNMPRMNMPRMNTVPCRPAIMRAADRRPHVAMPRWLHRRLTAALAAARRQHHRFCRDDLARVGHDSVAEDHAEHHREDCLPHHTALFPDRLFPDRLVPDKLHLDRLYLDRLYPDRLLPDQLPRDEDRLPIKTAITA